jgi:hypothetical protein
MAWTKSGLYVVNVVNLLKTVAYTGNTAGIGPFLLTTNKIALHSNALTDGTTPINFSLATPTWVNTSEVSGTGWAAGGVAFSAAAAGSTSTAPTLTESPTGSIMYDMADVSVAGTTLTSVRGCIIYSTAISAPVNLPSVIAITFGADYSTVAGTFAITWDVLGVCAIDITP